MEDSFIKARKFAYDRFVFFSSKQQKRESVDRFYSRLTEQATNCTLGDEETTIICDTFLLNMLDYEAQKELLKDTVTPHEVF